jgi:hypothetical protein
MSASDTDGAATDRAIAGLVPDRSDGEPPIQDLKRAGERRSGRDRRSTATFDASAGITSR